MQKNAKFLIENPICCSLFGKGKHQVWSPNAPSYYIQPCLKLEKIYKITVYCNSTQFNKIMHNLFVAYASFIGLLAYFCVQV